MLRAKTQIGFAIALGVFIAPSGHAQIISSISIPYSSIVFDYSVNGATVEAVKITSGHIDISAFSFQSSGRGRDGYNQRHLTGPNRHGHYHRHHLHRFALIQQHNRNRARSPFLHYYLAGGYVRSFF
jgi:hypothetical protein